MHAHIHTHTYVRTRAHTHTNLTPMHLKSQTTCTAEKHWLRSLTMLVMTGPSIPDIVNGIQNQDELIHDGMGIALAV